MRTVSLARVAARAEVLLVKRMVTTAARRAAYGAVAAVFAIGVLILLHVMAVMALEQFAHLTPLLAVAIVLVIDLIVAGIAGMLAAGKISDPVADEARRVRDVSIEQARQSLTMAALLAPATRMVVQTGLIRAVVEKFGARRSRR